MRRSGRSAAVWARLAAAWIALGGAIAGAGAIGASSARAESMDPALSRLRIVGGRPGCLNADAYEWCRNQEFFERLVSDLGISIAPSLHTPARGVGSRGLSLMLDMTLTSIDANAGYWKRGSEGD